MQAIGGASSLFKYSESNGRILDPLELIGIPSLRALCISRNSCELFYRKRTNVSSSRVR